MIHIIIILFWKNKMKILYIANSRIPTEKAHAIQILKTCEAFSLQNIDLKLILPTRYNPKFKKINIFNYYSIIKNFKIIKLLTPDPFLLVYLPQGIYTKIQTLFFIISLFFYLLFLKNKNQYVFYTRDEHLLPILHFFSKKVIWEAHILPTNKKHYVKIWKKCFKIITITQTLKAELINLKINSKKIIVTPDGVDLDKFQVLESKNKIRQQLNLPLDKKIILYTGHFYKWKGVQVLADATKFLDKNTLVVFVGGGDHKFEKFKKQNLTKNILFTDYQTPDKIPYYLKTADVLVLPNSSRDKKSNWTSPLKLFEYMASSIPIVASDLKNLREILNEKNAIFFKPDDVHDLADKIKYILDNSNKAELISAQVKKDIQSYTWQKRSEKIVNFINK